MQGLASSTARNCLPVHSCGNHTKFGTLFQNAIWHIYTILQNITTKNYCTNPDNPTNGGRGEHIKLRGGGGQPPSPRLYSPTWFVQIQPPATPRNGTSYFCKAEIALLPYRYSGKFLRRKIAPLFADIRFALG